MEKNLQNFGIIWNFFCLFLNEKLRQGCQNWLLRVHNINFSKQQSEEPKCGRKQFSCLLSKQYRRFCRKWIPRVRNDNLRNMVFVENNICFHHFRLLSENFSASLLNFFRWESQNCIFYFKKNKVRKKRFFQKCMYVSDVCFLHFRTLRPIPRPFVEISSALRANVDSTCSDNDFGEIILVNQRGECYHEELSESTSLSGKKWARRLFRCF